MKGKKGVYILLPLVLAIWVMIIYKVYKTVNGSEENVLSQFQDKSVTSAKQALDTFTLIADYRDPFLGKLMNVQSLKKNININAIKMIVPPVVHTTLPWPSVNYMGIIKNKKSSKQNVLIQVNGKELVLKEGDKAEGLLLSKIYRDSVEFKREKEVKYFKKAG